MVKNILFLSNPKVLYHKPANAAYSEPDHSHLHYHNQLLWDSFYIHVSKVLYKLSCYQTWASGARSLWLATSTVTWHHIKWEKHINSQQKLWYRIWNKLHTYNHILAKHTHNLNLQFFFIVFAGGGSLAFSAAAILATLLANAVKAVWGTNLGISGINLRPSIAQSADVLGPAML